MEEIELKTPKGETPKGETPGSFSFKVDLKYYINNSEEKKGKLTLLNFNNNYNKILYKEIAYSFYIFLRGIQYDLDSEECALIESEFLDITPININLEFIRYFNGKGWILLEEDDVIQLNERLNENNLKLIIKANILSEKDIKIEEKYKNIYREIDFIYSDLKNKTNIHYTPDSPLNLIVLTANPLMNGEKELRSMNDFNIIPATIYKLLQEEDYLKYTEFLPLTMSTLQEILIDEKKRPVILHLICKSTYIEKNIKLEINDKNEPFKKSDLYTNLIFEQDEDDRNNNKYNLEFIDKEKLEELKKILDSNVKLKENISKITLIISTPLAENVYDLFKNFGFKNLLVQHTTLADLNFIADFNYTFYKELIIRKYLPINELYELAINIYCEKKNPPTFCCCFHKHKNNCNFLKNIKNELYNDNNEINNITISNDFEEVLPHFYHLFSDCAKSYNCYIEIWSQRDLLLEPPSQYFEYSFSFHQKGCVNNFNNINKKNRIKFEFKDEEKKPLIFYNLCCCNEATEKHNKNNVFIKDFTKDKNNNKIGFRIPEMMTEKKFFPNYEKMKLLVGRNSIVLDVIQFFYSKELYYNIYGDSIENLKILVNITIEYYKEKNYYLYENEQDLSIKRIKSTPQLALRKLDSGISDNNIINIKNSEFIPDISNEKKFDFIEIELKKDKNINSNINNGFIFDKSNDNKIYFIYVYDTNLLDTVNKANKKIIFLSKEKLEQLNYFKKFQKLILEPQKKYYNYYIQNQHLKETKNWRKKKV